MLVFLRSLGGEEGGERGTSVSPLLRAATNFSFRPENGWDIFWVIRRKEEKLQDFFILKREMIGNKHLVKFGDGHDTFYGDIFGTLAFISNLCVENWGFWRQQVTELIFEYFLNAFYFLNIYPFHTYINKLFFTQYCGY